jgi:hypothetical protein
VNDQVMSGGGGWQDVFTSAMAGRKDACCLSMLNYCEQLKMKLNLYFLNKVLKLLNNNI